MISQPVACKYYLKGYYLYKLMDDIKTCTQCNLSMSIIKIQKFKKPRKDGSTRYGTWCVLCKADYNNAYMKRKDQTPLLERKRKHIMKITLEIKHSPNHDKLNTNDKKLMCQSKS